MNLLDIPSRSFQEIFQCDLSRVLDPETVPPILKLNCGFPLDRFLLNGDLGFLSLEIDDSVLNELMERGESLLLKKDEDEIYEIFWINGESLNGGNGP